MKKVQIQSLKRYYSIILIVLIFTTRVPLITSQFFQADGDEAIVGLMAKEIVDQGHFRIYFWGQRYGFVPFEASVAAVTFKILGMNEYSLKMSMLFVWCAGCLLLFGAIKSEFNPEVAFVFSLILIFCPVWGIWSMKARGGYITAFFFSSLLARLMAYMNKEKTRKFYLMWLAIGIILAIIYFSQKLWLLSLVPFFIPFIYRRGTLVKVLILSLALITTAFLIVFLAKNEIGDFMVLPKSIYFHFYPTVLISLTKLSVFFRATYFLGNVFVAGQFNSVVGVIWTCILALLVIAQIIRLVLGKFYFYSHTLCLATCLSMFALFANLSNDNTPDLEFRYLLPMAVPFILWFVVEFYDWTKSIRYKLVLNTFLAGFMILNFAALYQLRNISIEEIYQPIGLSFSDSMKEMIQFLEKQNVHATFSRNQMLIWQIDFYSNGRVLSRSKDRFDRNRDYIVPVTKDYLSGKPTAIVDNFNSKDLNPDDPGPGIDPHNIKIFGNQLKVYMNPTTETLQKLDYDLKTN